MSSSVLPPALRRVCIRHTERLAVPRSAEKRKPQRRKGALGGFVMLKSCGPNCSQLSRVGNTSDLVRPAQPLLTFPLTSLGLSAADRFHVKASSLCESSAPTSWGRAQSWRPWRLSSANCEMTKVLMFYVQAVCRPGLRIRPLTRAQDDPVVGWWALPIDVHDTNPLLSPPGQDTHRNVGYAPSRQTRLCIRPMSSNTNTYLGGRSGAFRVPVEWEPRPLD
jgi:hypothetical protein